MTSRKDPRFEPHPQFSDHPPLRLLLVLGGGFLALVLVAWLVAGLFVGWVAEHVPRTLEERIGEVLPVDRMQSEDRALLRAREHLQEIVDRMAGALEGEPFPLRVHVVDDPLVNAVALPGGHIVVYRGLLEAVGSENELAMVLGHEIGHHVHRDHLRAAGRRLVAAWALFTVLGTDAGLVDLSLEGLQREHSRSAESAADQLGLRLLVHTYGHAGGATEFFDRIVDRDPRGPWRWASTHPPSRARIEALRQEIEVAELPVRAPRPLPDFSAP